RAHRALRHPQSALPLAAVAFPHSPRAARLHTDLKDSSTFPSSHNAPKSHAQRVLEIPPAPAPAAAPNLKQTTASSHQSLSPHLPTSPAAAHTSSARQKTA